MIKALTQDAMMGGAAVLLLPSSCCQKDQPVSEAPASPSSWFPQWWVPLSSQGPRVVQAAPSQ